MISLFYCRTAAAAMQFYLVSLLNVLFNSCRTAAVPNNFVYEDGGNLTEALLTQRDNEMNSRNLRSLMTTGWFNKKFAAVVLDLDTYTPHSNLVTQVRHTSSVIQS